MGPRRQTSQETQGRLKGAGTILDVNLVELGRVRLFRVLGSTRSWVVCPTAHPNRRISSHVFCHGADLAPPCLAPPLPSAADCAFT